MLHYNIYQNSRIGLCNAMMSVENALIIAFFTNKDITFYASESLFNSEKKLTLFDLYDINYNYKLIKSNEISIEIPRLQYDLHSTVIYRNQYPDSYFLNGRNNTINLLNLPEEIATKNNQTLGFYSYIFYLDKHEKHKMLQFLTDCIKPKFIYTEIANNILTKLPIFNCIHFRRGDFTRASFTKTKDITTKDIVDNIRKHFNNDIPLLILSDELNNEFFSELSSYYKVIYMNDYLGNYTELDNAEKGLISMLVASYSRNFIGTMKSTFTAFIQRERLKNGFKEDFKYLYNQNDLIPFKDGKIIEEKEGLYSWNRLNLPKQIVDINFWFREWIECYN